MSTINEPTPIPQDPAPEREITVKIPADRADAFEHLVQRFLSAGERPHRRRCGGKHRGPRGGRHVHVHLHG